MSIYSKINVESIDFSSTSSVSTTQAKNERIGKLEQEVEELKEELNSLKRSFEDFNNQFE